MFRSYLAKQKGLMSAIILKIFAILSDGNYRKQKQTKYSSAMGKGSWDRILTRFGGKFKIEIFFKKLSSFLEFWGLMDWHIFEIYKKKEINLFKFRYNQKSTRIKLNSALNIITPFGLKFGVQFLLSAPPIGIYSAFSAICS